MRTLFLVPLFLAAPAFAGEPAAPLKLIPVEGGGYAIERDAVAPLEAKGIATVAEIVPLLSAQANAEKVDYANGQKLDGVFTVIVGRDDGTLGKYEGAVDIIVFAAPKSLTQVKGVTTLEGGVVFALKIDNARAVQRFERGVITLTQTKKAV